MKKFFTLTITLLSLSVVANVDESQLADLSIRVQEANRTVYEIMGKEPQSCKSVTSCTTDFQGKSSCTTKLICDLRNE